MTFSWVPRGPWIDGEVVEAGPETLVVVSPSSGQAWATVQAGDAAVVDRAVQAAHRAFVEGRLRRIPPLARQRLLMDVAEAIRRHEAELARLIAEEMGMPATTARYIEVPYAAAVFEYYAGLATAPTGETLPVDVPGAPPAYFAYTLAQPVGVAGLITPWNFPLLLPAWKIAPALAAGATVVLKPAPESPLTALALARILDEAGVPPGVVNVVPGPDTTGEALVRHPGVRQISFTGETATGRAVLRAAADDVKRVHVELGGKSPAVVFADADLDLAVAQCLFGIYFNSGQVCQAGSRILVQRNVYEPFLERFTARSRALRVGPATDPAVDLGPLVRADRLERVDRIVRDTVAGGARLLTGGTRISGPGYFYAPTVLADVDPEAPAARQEIFGPVAAVLPFEDDAAALELAHRTVYGLAAAVFTRDVRRALGFARDLCAGTVWINTSQVLTPTAPFGGLRRSGFGRELGRAGFEAYRETKTVLVDLNDEPLTYF
jgi:acyl-CoA reductase-like NAD-dependent aldehyde dehydrogenase